MANLDLDPVYEVECDTCSFSFATDNPKDRIVHLGEEYHRFVPARSADSEHFSP